MKIRHGMILAAGLGQRMLPITLKTPKYIRDMIIRAIGIMMVVLQK